MNASGITQYELGLTEGNTSGIAWVQANPGNYQYFSEADVNASLTEKYELGFADGNLTGSILVAEEIENLKISSAEDGGRAQAIATVQAEFAREKLSFVPYEQEMVESIPYTVGWFHVPAVGWMWTTPEVFPHLYLHNEGGSGKWVYFDPHAKQVVPFFDHNENKWINILK